jgi:hypothetical protein
MAPDILPGWSGDAAVKAATAHALTRIHPAERPQSPARHRRSSERFQTGRCTRTTLPLDFARRDDRRRYAVARG